MGESVKWNFLTCCFSILTLSPTGSWTSGSFPDSVHKGLSSVLPWQKPRAWVWAGGESRAKSLVLWHFTCQAASSHPPLKFYGFEKEFCLIMPFTTCSEYQDGFNVIVISLFKMDFDLKYQIWSRRCKSAALTRIFTWKQQQQQRQQQQQQPFVALEETSQRSLDTER